MKFKRLLFEMIDSKTLREDVEERKMFRDQARQVWSDFIDYIESGGGFRAGFFDVDNPNQPEPEDFGLSTTIANISPYVDDDRLTIALLTSNVQGEGRYNDQNHVLFLKVFPTSKIKEIYEEKLEVVNRVGGYVDYTELAELIAEEIRGDIFDYLGEEEKEVFMHEYTHYIDFTYKNAVMSYDRENVLDNLAEYFNDPVETNARFQAALAKFEDEYQHGKFESSFQNFRDFQSYFFENYGSILGLDSIMNIDKDVIKSFKKRLYKYWDKFLTND